jgi:hypothetical protein
MLEGIPLTDETRKLPIMIFWGKDDKFGAIKPIQEQSWETFRYLRERGHKLVEQKEYRGGHLRMPELAYQYWSAYLPEEHRK